MYNKNKISTNNIEILIFFDNLCQKNKIWYSLSNTTLLESQIGKAIQENEIINVMMTVKSYKKLLKIANDNIVDSSKSSDYFLLNPFFISKEINGIIKINILVKSSIKKAEKNYTIKNLIRQKVGYYKNLKGNINFKNKIKKIFYKVIGLFFSPLTWIEVCSKIYDENYEGYFLIESFKPNINQNWLHSLTMETKRIKWNNVETQIIIESDIYLKKNYGLNWKKKNIVEKSIDFSYLTKN